MPPCNLLIKPASSLCNMRCRYCFYADVSSRREVQNRGVMSEETLEILVRAALRYASGSCGFNFQGGEPTLAGLDFYRRLIELQNKYNVNRVEIFNAIQTNGYLIDDEWAKFLADNRFLVGLSLDGPAEIHDACRLDPAGKGTHTRVLRAAAALDRQGAEYNILCVVNNFVARHGRKVYNFFRQSGFRYLQFIPCLDPFDGDERHDYSLTAERYAGFLKATFDLYYDDFCRGEYTSVRTFDNYVSMLAGRPPEACGMQGVCSSYFTVEGDGSVYPCDFYVLDRYRMGSVLEDSFAAMAGSEAAVRFVEESKPVDSSCQSCGYFPFCRGGCRRYREPFVDGRPGLNKFCSAYREFFDHALPRMQRMAAVLSRGQR